MPSPRPVLGSLCTGHGGIERGLALADVEFRLGFVADNDPAASALLAHHHPQVPNLGDLKAVNWRSVPPVDVLTAGYPCQPFSDAGKRKGTADERHLWPWVAHAVRVLRPRLVLLENVVGHLGRGFAAVVADLASFGYVGSWVCVRASDVGAPHRRERVFVAATPADAPFDRHRYGWTPVRQRIPATAVGGAVRPDGLMPTPRARDGKGRDPNPKGYDLNEAVALLPTPGARLGGDRGTPNAATAGRRLHDEGRRNLEDAVALLPTPRAADGVKGGPNQRGGSGDLMLPSAVLLLPTPTVADARGTRNATAGRTEPTAGTDAHHDGWTLSDVAYADRWGRYAPAIARWETILGRPVPAPTEAGSKGQPRLSPAFVEWLMGLTAGHVTAVPGLSRNDQLRLLGNGVVPQQCAVAVPMLLVALAEVGDRG